MTVINTSPSVHLHAVLPGGLALLPRLVGEVVVPFEVGRELAAGLDRDDTWKKMQNIPRLTLRPSPVVLHPLLRTQLDAGEAAVIQTALNEGIATVILDERKARRVALTMGLSVTGTLGILVQAKRSGLLSSVSEAIQTLKARGIWLDERLLAKVLSLAGEAP